MHVVGHSCSTEGIYFAEVSAKVQMLVLCIFYFNFSVHDMNMGYWPTAV